MLFSEELPVHIAFWDRIMSTNVERRVSDLNWKTIVKIQETDLAHILQLATCLTNFGFLVSSIPARSPPKNREWSCTDLTLLIIIRLCLHTKKPQYINQRVINELQSLKANLGSFNIIYRGKR